MWEFTYISQKGGIAMSATLKQANQFLNLISQKDKSSVELQALYASGLLSDLLDADVSQVDREKFRELLGIKSFLPLTIRVSDTSDVEPPFRGWKILKDAKTPIGTLRLKLAEFLKRGESSVIGMEMLRRSDRYGFTLGLRHAKALLAKEDSIPKEWQKYSLVFLGTVGEGSIGGRFIPRLCWDRDHWSSDWLAPGSDYDGNFRIVVCE